MKKGYNWYRHHAWGGLAILSLFTGLHAFFSVPSWITLPVGIFLLGYVIFFLFLTFLFILVLKLVAEMMT